MSSTRLVVSTLFAFGLVAGAAWAGPVSTSAKQTVSTTHVAAKAHAAKAEAMPRTDLNAATKEDLMKLPGVDEAIADKIIAARPFKGRAELRSKSIVSGTEYAKLRDKVTAKPAPATASQ